jgi:hypothetical protein
MAKVITAQLLESHDLHGRARRLDEDDDGGDYDDYVTADRHADLYDDADDAEDSVPARARRVTAEEFLDSLTEDDDAEFAEEFRALLAKHRKVRGGGVGARPGGEVTHGPGGKVSRESREDWLRRLRGQRSLREEREAQRRLDCWLTRLRGG